jgi:uncharacterized membrane protein YoaK (UPF0700 family)
MNPRHDKVRHGFVLAMSLVAGCVDGMTFVNAGVFPANMTGNSVVLAVSLFNQGMNHSHETHAALVLLGFCCGCSASSLLIRSERGVWSRSVNLVILISGLVLLLWGWVFFTRMDAGFSLTQLFLVSIAMGMQSTTVLHLNIPGAGTSTAVTSTLTALVSRSVHHLKAMLLKGGKATLPSPGFPFLVFTLYFGGALLGGLQRGIHCVLAAGLAGLLLMAIAICAEYYPTSTVVTTD